MTEAEQARRIAVQCAAQILAGSGADLVRTVSMIALMEKAMEHGALAAMLQVAGMLAATAQAMQNQQATDAQPLTAEQIKRRSEEAAEKVVPLRPANEPA